MDIDLSMTQAILIALTVPAVMVFGMFMRELFEITAHWSLFVLMALSIIFAVVFV